MKKNILLLLVLLFIAMSFNKTSKYEDEPFTYNIEVNFKDSKLQDGEVFYLNKSFLDNTYRIVDSCVKKNNRLFFNRKTEEPFLGYISLKRNDTIWCPGFVVSKDNISIDWADWDYKDIYAKKNVKVKGGEKEYMKQNFDFLNIPSDIRRDIQNQLDQFGTVDPKSSNYEYWSNYEKKIYNWVTENNDKYYTLYKFYNCRSELSKKTILMCLEFLKINFGNTSRYKDLLIFIKTRELNLIGKQFADIELIDNMQKETKSKNIFLPNKEFYILDFGASWCGYCILQARELNKNYSKIDSTKIQIISISIDKEIKDWLPFEKRENYKWKSFIINKKLDKNNFVGLLASVPTYFVLDSNKKIIEKYNALDSIPFLKFK